MGLCVAVLLKDTGSRSELKALLDGQPGLQLRAVGAGGIEPEQVVELNPALQRQGRQRQLATWLLPALICSAASRICPSVSDC